MPARKAKEVTQIVDEDIVLTPDNGTIDYGDEPWVSPLVAAAQNGEQVVYDMGLTDVTAADDVTPVAEDETTEE